MTELKFFSHYLAEFMSLLIFDSHLIEKCRLHLETF